MVANTLGFFIVKIAIIICHSGQVTASQQFRGAIQKPPKNRQFLLTFVLLDYSVTSARANGDCIGFTTRVEFTVQLGMASQYLAIHSHHFSIQSHHILGHIL